LICKDKDQFSLGLFLRILRLCYIYCCISIELLIARLNNHTLLFWQKHTHKLVCLICQNFHLVFFVVVRFDLVMLICCYSFCWHLPFKGYNKCLRLMPPWPCWLDFFPFQESSDGQSMMEFRRSLPAYKEKQTLLEAISQNQVLFLF